MQQMQFPSILAFVEGSMEQLFFQKNFHYVEIIPVSNGVKWSVPQMCEQIATFYEARNFFGDRIIVWIDREGRIETVDDIRSAIHARLVSVGAPPDQLAIMICDRMTENVILADEIAVREVVPAPDYVYKGDGCGGKYELKSLYKEVGINYKEMNHGVAFLKKIRLERAAERSPPVRDFLDSLSLGCWWINQGV